MSSRKSLWNHSGFSKISSNFPIKILELYWIRKEKWNKKNTVDKIMISGKILWVISEIAKKVVKTKKEIHENHCELKHNLQERF